MAVLNAAIQDREVTAGEKCTGLHTYPTDCHLHDGVEAALRGIQIPRDLLLAHQVVELLPITGEAQHILVAEGAGAVLVAGAWVQHLGRCGADVRHHSLFHKGTKACNTTTGQPWDTNQPLKCREQANPKITGQERLK